ncbi:MAG: BACON domain-containing protein, partial [Ardenticatenaceae bacterium]
PGDVPWLSVEPTSGTTPGNSSSPVAVSYDSGGLTPGAYAANLCVNSDDPDEPTVIVPVSLTVEEPTALRLDHLAAQARDIRLPAAVALLLALGVVGATGLLLRRQRRAR